MATVDKQGVVTMQELIASSLAQTDALTKLLIEKGLITKDEFMVKLSVERAVYREMLGKMGYAHKRYCPWEDSPLKRECRTTLSLIYHRRWLWVDRM